jgi:hypothetical protein
MPPKRKLSREEWQDLENWERTHKKVRCPYCRDTGRCHRCGGAGCMECSYVGICQHCSDEKRAYVEGLA